MKATFVCFLLVAVVASLAAADYHHGGHQHGGYHHEGHVLPGPEKVLTFPVKAPVPPCGALYLLSCLGEKGKVPCVPHHEHHGHEHKHGHEHGHGYHHAPAPAKY